MGPYQRTPKEVARAIRFSGLGVRSVGPVGDFLDLCNNRRESWMAVILSNIVGRVKLHKGSSFYQDVMRILMVTICVGGFTILQKVLMGLIYERIVNNISNYKELS